MACSRWAASFLLCALFGVVFVEASRLDEPRKSSTSRETKQKKPRNFGVSPLMRVLLRTLRSPLEPGTQVQPRKSWVWRTKRSLAFSLSRDLDTLEASRRFPLGWEQKQQLTDPRLTGWRDSPRLHGRNIKRCHEQGTVYERLECAWLYCLCRLGPHPHSLLAKGPQRDRYGSDAFV